MTDSGVTYVHINRGVNRRYAAMVREHGCRKYQLVGKWTKSEKVAHRALMTAMMNRNWKRGVLLFAADYYDPEPILRVCR